MIPLGNILILKTHLWFNLAAILNLWVLGMLLFFSLPEEINFCVTHSIATIKRLDIFYNWKETICTKESLQCPMSHTFPIYWTRHDKSSQSSRKLTICFGTSRDQRMPKNKNEAFWENSVRKRNATEKDTMTVSRTTAFPQKTTSVPGRLLVPRGLWKTAQRRFAKWPCVDSFNCTRISFQESSTMAFPLPTYSASNLPYLSVSFSLSPTFSLFDCLLTLSLNMLRYIYSSVHPVAFKITIVYLFSGSVATVPLKSRPVEWLMIDFRAFIIENVSENYYGRTFKFSNLNCSYLEHEFGSLG